MSENKAEIKKIRKTLCDFFVFFRENGEDNIGMTIEEFVDLFLKEKEVVENE